MNPVVLWVCLLAYGALVAALWLLITAIEEVASMFRERRRARIERELDRTQAELRRTILLLAQELDASAHETRKTLIRESFLARGELPDRER